MDALLGINFNPVEFLMCVHYRHFMVNPRFWYEPNLIAADAIICLAASDLRKEQRYLMAWS